VSRPTASGFRLLSSPAFICLLLALATLAVYSSVRTHEFVDYDDSGYFFANPHVLGGLTGDNTKWAFTSGEYANWHPLTWLSLMMDASFFGNGPTTPHITNVLLHIANAILVFLLFRQMTGAHLRSAALAMLFALHPLHVESVAWVAERKDVLSGFFGLLSLLCYARFVANEKSRAAQKTGFMSFMTCYLSGFYWFSLFFFVCGLMSKPMLVTLPFVMLLLDFWPLQRFNRSTVWRLIVEKIPFFLLSAAASAVTFIVQQKGGAVTTLTRFPLDMRIENAFVSYARYLGKIFWPVNLATPYEPVNYWPGFVVALSIGLFAGLCIATVVLAKKYPFTFTGWFWFAGMLVPVIGLVQVGGQALADRYVYLPLLGVLVIIVGGAREICFKYQVPERAIPFFAAFLFLLCAVRARSQVSVWRDDQSLFEHALAVTKNNYVADLDLGYWYSKNGRPDRALAYYNEARHMAPDDPTALYDVGNAFAKLGHWEEAIQAYRHALEITPNQPDIMDNLGFALAQNKQLPEAIPYFEAVLKLEPNSPNAHNNLATALFVQGNYREAEKEFSAALQLSPDNPRIAANLGDTFIRLGQTNEAIQCYEKALQLQPDNARVRAKLQSLGVQQN
jgi:protein O-mannosyl-transferase